MVMGARWEWGSDVGDVGERNNDKQRDLSL